MPSSACDWSSDVCSSDRSEEHTSELQSRSDLVCRLLLEKKKTYVRTPLTIRDRMSPSAAKPNITAQQLGRPPLSSKAHITLPDPILACELAANRHHDPNR